MEGHAACGKAGRPRSRFGSLDRARRRPARLRRQRLPRRQPGPHALRPAAERARRRHAGPDAAAPAPDRAQAGDDGDEALRTRGVARAPGAVPLVAAPAAGVLDGRGHSRRPAEVGARRIRPRRSLQGRAAGAAGMARRQRSCERGKRRYIHHSCLARRLDADAHRAMVAATRPGTDHGRDRHRTTRRAGHAGALPPAQHRHHAGRRQLQPADAAHAGQSAVAERWPLADPRHRRRPRRRGAGGSQRTHAVPVADAGGARVRLGVRCAWRGRDHRPADGRCVARCAAGARRQRPGGRPAGLRRGAGAGRDAGHRDRLRPR